MATATTTDPYHVAFGAGVARTTVVLTAAFGRRFEDGFCRYGCRADFGWSRFRTWLCVCRAKTAKLLSPDGCAVGRRLDFRTVPFFARHPFAHTVTMRRRVGGNRNNDHPNSNGGLVTQGTPVGRDVPVVPTARAPLRSRTLRRGCPSSRNGLFTGTPTP